MCEEREREKKKKLPSLRQKKFIFLIERERERESENTLLLRKPKFTRVHWLACVHTLLELLSAAQGNRLFS